MNELEEIHRLVEAFARSTFTQLTLATEGMRIRLRQRPRLASARAPVAPVSSPEVAAAAPATPPGPERRLILSARVGHFHALRGRDRELTLKPGDRIDEGQVYGLVESMNLRYELKADKGGVIDRYLVEDGDPVEYEEPLLELR